jgi:hypothetical protein
MDRLVYLCEGMGAGSMKPLLLEMLKQLVLMVRTLSTNQAFADLCWTTLYDSFSGFLILINLTRSLKFAGGSFVLQVVSLKMVTESK